MRADTEGMEIVFDLDGTLTDPGVGISRCIQHALGALGRPMPAADGLKRFVGPPLRQAFAELLGTADEALLADAVLRYRQRFEAIGMFENTVYPGLPAALRELSRQGHRLWVATSKPRPYAVRILEHFELVSRFAGVYGSDFSGHDSDKGTLLRNLLGEQGIDRAHACMVGDRAHDVLGARENGILSVAVLWGYGTAEELEAVGPDRTVRSPSELCECLGDG
jgi:phosphoglycolate phosphatase